MIKRMVSGMCLVLACNMVVEALYYMGDITTPALQLKLAFIVVFGSIVGLSMFKEESNEKV